MGDARVSIFLDPIFEKLALYRDKFASYLTARVLAAHCEDDKMPQQLTGFEFPRDGTLVKMVRSLKLEKIDLTQEIVGPIDAAVQNTTTSVIELPTPFSDTSQLTVWRRYAEAVHGAVKGKSPSHTPMGQAFFSSSAWSSRIGLVSLRERRENHKMLLMFAILCEIELFMNGSYKHRSQSLKYRLLDKSRSHSEVDEP